MNEVPRTAALTGKPASQVLEEALKFCDMHEATKMKSRIEKGFKAYFEIMGADENKRKDKAWFKEQYSILSETPTKEEGERQIPAYVIDEISEILFSDKIYDMLFEVFTNEEMFEFIARWKVVSESIIRKIEGR